VKRNDENICGLNETIQLPLLKVGVPPVVIVVGPPPDGWYATTRDGAQAGFDGVTEQFTGPANAMDPKLARSTTTNNGVRIEPVNIESS
jgi:hypothetical protein